MVVRVLRAFWIQLVLTGLGAAALIAFADRLGTAAGQLGGQGPPGDRRLSPGSPLPGCRAS